MWNVERNPELTTKPGLNERAAEFTFEEMYAIVNHIAVWRKHL